MRDIENTAVNEIVSRARSTHDDPEADPAPLALPVALPVAAPFDAPTLRVPRSARGWLSSDGHGRGPEPTWSQAPAPAWREPASPRRLYELASQPDQERMVPTFQIRRRSEVRAVVGKLVLPIAILVSTGVILGAYVAFGGDGGTSPALAAAAAGSPSHTPGSGAALEPTSAPAPAPAAGPAVTAAPVTAPAAVAAGVTSAPVTAPPAVARPAAAQTVPAAPSLVDVRIDSTPAGATVTLVDRGRTQLVGETPVDTAFDPSRAYDLVFTYARGPAHVEHLDPATTRRVTAVLAAREAAPRPAEAAPRRVERAAGDGRSGRASRGRAESGQGTLMISSKPPCEIVIDGRATGLTTPQRAIGLPAGSHRITLLNSEQSIEKTLTVRIAANSTEKVVEDLMR